jgi:DNA-binding HxlR family transcriptional regulator
VAEAGAARRPRPGAKAHEPAPAERRPGARRADLAPESVIHHRLRLGIVSALAAADSLTFNELKALLKTTDGNLSVHCRKLEDAQHVVCTKTFEGRRPRTEYRLAPLGRRELARYLNHMEALIRATRSTLGH